MYGFENDIMFKLVPVIITIGFIVFLGMFVSGIVQNIKQNKKDNESPILTVDATVVDKRDSVRRSSTYGAGMENTQTSTSTEYYEWKVEVVWSFMCLTMSMGI